MSRCDLFKRKFDNQSIMEKPANQRHFRSVRNVIPASEPESSPENDEIQILA